MLRVLLLPLLALSIACGSSSGDDGNDSPGTQDASVSDLDAAVPADAMPPVQGTCAEQNIGSGDGCDCGCGEPDPDCPSPANAEDCAYDNCPENFEVDPSDPSFCRAIDLPAGWTCGASLYGDGVCSCGCGGLDDVDCPSDLEIGDCYYYHNGCPNGMWPDPSDPTGCTTAAAGFTCNWKSYYDGVCSCGCGVADPDCPAGAGLAQCQNDGCGSGKSPDPKDVTTYISNAPQDKWTCDLALLFDGQNCDCGCGAIDPDCPAGATANDCDAVHCGSQDELKPGSIETCWEICEPIQQSVGSATCTNGGSISIFGSCHKSLSACTDGHSYEVECTGSQCVCKVDGQCVAHATGGCSLNTTCGWNLVDNT